MLYALVVAGAILCAILAVRAARLIPAALWLAGLSALVSILLYALGAREVAVIELSVGAGLVTVLFVFAIGIAGDEAMDVRSLLPKPLAWLLVLIAMTLLGWMILPSLGEVTPRVERSFAEVLWQDRGLDVLVQIALIFAGALGVLGLLAEARAPAEKKTARESFRLPKRLRPNPPGSEEVRP